MNILRFLTKSYPRLPKIRKLDELPAEMKQLNHQLTELVYLGMMPRIGGSFMEDGKLNNPLLRRDVFGFPQGAPISCFLSIVALEKSLYTLWPNFVQYADDGLFYGDDKLKDLVADRERLSGLPEQSEVPEGKLSENMPMIAAGCRFNYEKSGWVRKDGKWLKPLKFLGAVYDGITNTMSSKTRSGKTL
jgi:hypothetical protein